MNKYLFSFITIWYSCWSGFGLIWFWTDAIFNNNQVHIRSCLYYLEKEVCPLQRVMDNCDWYLNKQCHCPKRGSNALMVDSATCRVNSESALPCTGLPEPSDLMSHFRIIAVHNYYQGDINWILIDQSTTPRYLEVNAVDLRHSRAIVDSIGIP